VRRVAQRLPARGPSARPAADAWSGGGPSMLITFSGLDGAGKSTLIERLKITLEQQHCRVAVFHINDHVGVYAYLRALRDRVRGGGGAIPSNGSPPTAPPAPSSRLRAAYRRVRNAVLWNKPLRRLIYPVDLLVFLVYRVYVEKLRKQVLVMDRYFYDTLVDAGTGFRIVPARALLPELPADLSAILFHERAPVGHTVRVCAVGDSGLSGQVGRTGSELGYGALLREVAPLLQSAAAAFANLEGTLIERPRDALFAAPPAAAEALRQAGVTIVHLANNHVYDFGPTGLASTLAAAAGANLVALGAGDDAAASRRLVRTECRG